eukprot:125560-Pelagomonas_calceolata.AAC.2
MLPEASSLHLQFFTVLQSRLKASNQNKLAQSRFDWRPLIPVSCHLHCRAGSRLLQPFASMEPHRQNCLLGSLVHTGVTLQSCVHSLEEWTKVPTIQTDTMARALAHLMPRHGMQYSVSHHNKSHRGIRDLPGPQRHLRLLAAWAKALSTHVWPSA